MNLLSTIFGFKKAPTSSQPLEVPSAPMVALYSSEASKSFREGRHQEALLHCEKALNLAPGNADLYRLRGVVKYQLQDFTGAAEDLQYSLKLA